MEQPPEYINQGEHMLYKLKKVMYGLSKVHELSLISSVVSSLKCGVISAILITLSSFKGLLQVVEFLWFMLMTFY